MIPRQTFYDIHIHFLVLSSCLKIKCTNTNTFKKLVDFFLNAHDTHCLKNYCTGNKNGFTVSTKEGNKKEVLTCKLC